MILFGYLDVQFGLRPAPAVRYKAVSAVAQPAIVVLSALAYAGQSQPDDIQRAFQAGARPVRPGGIVPPQQCTFDTFDAALGQLAQASPAVKRRFWKRCGLHRRRRQDDRRGKRVAPRRSRCAGLPAAACAG